MRPIVAVSLFTLAACGGRYPAAGEGKPAADGPRGVEAAALPFSIVDRAGKAVAEDAFWAALGDAKVVCVGEDHPNPHHHWAQLTIVDRLTRARPAGLALGMEMVQRPFQAVLDDYRAGRIDDAALLSRTGWEDRWSYDFQLYRPAIRVAVERGATLLALNAARELTKKVVRQGLESLTAEERAGLARDLVLDDTAHRAWFDGVMADMGGAEGHAHAHASSGPPAEPAEPPEAPEAPEADEKRGELTPPPPSADRIYTVQVIWDETMAEGAATWAKEDGRAIVVLAGNGHCHDSAIVGRVARRGVTPVVSVRPIIDDGAGNVAAAIQEGHNDFLFVMTMPR